MVHAVLAVFDRVRAVFLLALLALLALGLTLREGDAPAVRRPLEAAHALVNFGESPRLAAVRSYQVDLPLVATGRPERQPAAVRRPLGAPAAPVRGARELERLPTLAHQPDLGVVAVLVPVRGAHGECDRAAVRGYRGAADVVQTEDVLERRAGNLGLLGREGCGKNSGGQAERDYEGNA